MAKNKSIGVDFRTGSIPKLMLGFALPYMLASALQVVYSLIDMIIVGQFVGKGAISGVSISSQINLFFTSIGIGYAAGGQVFIAQLMGRDQHKKLNEAIGTLTTVSFILAIISTVVSLLLRDWILRIVHTPAESYEMAMNYFIICSAGLVFTFGYNLVASILRGMGDSNRPLLFIAIATVVNLTLDLLFVGAFHWGTAGAAWATIIGQAVSFIASVIFLYRRKELLGFDFKLKSFKIDKKSCIEITKLGGVMAIQTAAIYLSMIVVTGRVNTLGVVPSAAFGIGLKVDDLIIKITFGINVANTTIIGQNFAAGDHDRVKKSIYTAWLYALICYAVFAVFYLGWAQGLFRCFTSDKDVIALAPVYTSAFIWSFPGFIIMRGTNGCVQGTGNAFLGFVAAMLDAVILRIGLSYLFGIMMGGGFFGFCLGYSLAVYGSCLPQLVYYLSGKWKKRRVLTD